MLPFFLSLLLLTLKPPSDIFNFYLEIFHPWNPHFPTPIIYQHGLLLTGAVKYFPALRNKIRPWKTTFLYWFTDTLIYFWDYNWHFTSAIYVCHVCSQVRKCHLLVSPHLSSLKRERGEIFHYFLVMRRDKITAIKIFLFKYLLLTNNFMIISTIKKWKLENLTPK